MTKRSHLSPLAIARPSLDVVAVLVSLLAALLVYLGILPRITW
jgi:hypothetical protein